MIGIVLNKKIITDEKSGTGPTFTMIFEENPSKLGCALDATYQIDGLTVNITDYKLALATMIGNGFLA